MSALPLPDTTAAGFATAHSREELIAQLRKPHALLELVLEFKPTFKVLLVGWLFLLTFITVRLAMALELV